MCSGMSNTIDLITPSITGRRHGVVKKTISQTLQGLKEGEPYVIILEPYSGFRGQTLVLEKIQENLIKSSL